MSDSLEDLRLRVELLKPIADKCKAMMNGEDPVWEQKKTAIIEEMSRDLTLYKSGNVDAAFILGRLSRRIEELDAPRLQLMDFEAKQRRYKERLQRERAPEA